MFLVTRDELVLFLKVERQVSKLTETDCENPTPENEELLAQYIKMIDKYDHMGISVDGYCSYYGLNR